jgi:hypothetical protein
LPSGVEDVRTENLFRPLGVKDPEAVAFDPAEDPDGRREDEFMFAAMGGLRMLLPEFG